MNYLRINPSQTGQFPFRTVLAHHLHAHANPEHGHFVCQDALFKDLPQARRVKSRHCPVERADPWQDDFLGAGKFLWRVRDTDRNIEPVVDMGKSLDIAQPIIDQCYRNHD